MPARKPKSTPKPKAHAASHAKLDGEVYYPSETVIAQANVPNWEALAEHAHKDLASFWANRADELEWY